MIIVVFFPFFPSLNSPLVCIKNVVNSHYQYLTIRILNRSAGSEDTCIFLALKIQFMGESIGESMWEVEMIYFKICWPLTRIYPINPIHSQSNMVYSHSQSKKNIWRKTKLSMNVNDNKKKQIGNALWINKTQHCNSFRKHTFIQLLWMGLI